MIKHEIKVEFKDSNELLNLIRKSYFIEGNSGKILKKNHYLKIDESKDIEYSILKGLNGGTVKIHNDDIINGNMRFMIEESNDDIHLYPISIYALMEDDKYSFY